MRKSPRFNRKFSVSLYKDLKIKLGEMTFPKDFVTEKKGDLYPLGERSDDCLERVRDGRYEVLRGRVLRLFCQFFPFASYEVRFSAQKGEVGFEFRLPDTVARMTLRAHTVLFACGAHREELLLPSDATGDEYALIVSCRPRAFDVYVRVNERPRFVGTVYEDAFRDSHTESIFTESYVFLTVSGEGTVIRADSYIDSGVSVADIRPIRYEDGSVMVEGGKMYFTVSIRMQESSFQGVLSWIPGTAELSMTGAVFYHAGDGKWRNYVAPVMLYDRTRQKWLVWVSAFENGHILAYAAFEGDVRFGVNVIDVTGMEAGAEGDDISAFVGFRGDEDPDLLYDVSTGRWLLALCRLEPETHTYTYVFFESDDPFSGFKYIGRGLPGQETGGSFVLLHGKLCFVCGNSFDQVSEYRIYSEEGMETVRYRYPDGGFRGWGSVFPLKMGSRTRYFQWTFDRHNGSDYNWSYGNLYCFELTEADV